MSKINLFLANLAVGAALLGLGGCLGPGANQQNALEPSSPAADSLQPTPDVPEQPLTVPTTQPTVTSQAANPPAADMATVTLYRVNSQCDGFVPEQAQVEADRAMDAAVGRVIEGQSSADFSLTGYRVSFNADTGEATVDLRTAIDSRRKLVSLSTCEQFALLGSIRETLLNNPQWQVQSVRFTERGEALVL